MLSDLFKRLSRGLAAYLRYQLSGLFGLRRNATTQLGADTSSKTIATALPRVTLDPIYTKTVTWETDRNDVAALDLHSNPVYQLWQQSPRSPKWTQYFEIYQAVFGPRRSMPMRILEIGVFRGASLRLWKNYFHHEDTCVVGVDIDPQCAMYDAPLQRIHVRIGSQADGQFLASVVEEFGPFDLIVDDGSHHSTHMIGSFNYLYAAGLKDDGIYFAEDIHSNYWIPTRDSANSFLDFCKDLLELMHAHYWNNLLSVWTNEQESNTRLAVQVPEITTMIREIRFFDSVVAIYKMRRRHPPRWVIA